MEEKEKKYIKQNNKTVRIKKAEDNDILSKLWKIIVDSKSRNQK